MTKAKNLVIDCYPLGGAVKLIQQAAWPQPECGQNGGCVRDIPGKLPDE
jgi:hypothetical protein